MATLVKRKLSTNEATKLASAALDLDDLKRLAVALTEAAAEEVVRNRTFANRVRTLYAEIPTSTRKVIGATALDSDLVPIRRIEGRAFDPAAPLDPYFLLDLYGPHQLEKALNLFPTVKLKEASAKVEQQHLGTKPENRGSKAALVAYIVGKLAT
jgi:hypothetical protein